MFLAHPLADRIVSSDKAPLLTSRAAHAVHAINSSNIATAYRRKGSQYEGAATAV